MHVFKKWKKLLSILLCLCMLVQNAQVMAFAAETDGICVHHTEHDELCGYFAGTACGHICGDDCKTVDCQHAHGKDGCTYLEAQPAVNCHPEHTEDCGYREEIPCACDLTDGQTHQDCSYVAEVPCTVIHEDCGCQPEVPASGTCPHTCTEEGCVIASCVHTGHDEACGYMEATPCTYRCGICTVQPLVDALPDEVTAENAEQVKAQLTAIDTAKAGLSDVEMAQVDFTKYTDAVSAIHALEGQPGADEACTAVNEITEVKVTVTVPLVGQSGNTVVFSCEESANYTLTAITEYWVDASGAEATEFRDGNYYSVRFTVTPKEGYTLTQNTTVTVNGSSEGVNKTEGEIPAAEFEFTCNPVLKGTIDSIELTGVPTAVVGEKN